jgi:hypothetical protein
LKLSYFELLISMLENLVLQMKRISIARYQYEPEKYPNPHSSVFLSISNRLVAKVVHSEDLFFGQTLPVLNLFLSYFIVLKVKEVEFPS